MNKKRNYYTNQRKIYHLYFDGSKYSMQSIFTNTLHLLKNYIIFLKYT